MEIAQLEAFEAVSREGSFTRAAEALNITQPAVSARITSLEAEMGGALFERHGRHLSLTPLGRAFLPYADRILTTMRESLQAVRDIRHGRMGEVRIAAPTPLLLSFLLDTLIAFRQNHPQVDIFIRERNKTTILELLLDGMMTLGLVNAPIFDKRLVALARFHDPIRAVVASAHPLAYSERVHMADLYAYTIFRVSMFPQMTAFMDAIVENGRNGSGGAIIALPMVMALQLVQMGQGVTFLPESYAKPAVTRGEVAFLSILDMPPLVSEPLLIAHKERKLDKANESFVELLKACWRSLLVG